MGLVGPTGLWLLLTLPLLLGCNAPAPETATSFPDTAERPPAAAPTPVPAPVTEWPDLVILYGPRIVYAIDVPPDTVEIPPGWIVDAKEPAYASVVGPGSAVFTIRLSQSPYPEANVDELEELFINSQEFREQVVPGSFRSFQTTIAGTSSRRILYRARSGDGCIIAINRVSLITGGLLVILTGSVCLEERELFPRQWIERMQTSFLLKRT